ncbi:undecaprenyl diphosphate synthase family protein [Nanoarchaeota archaeon]
MRLPGTSKTVPMHLAINTSNLTEWAEKEKKVMEEAVVDYISKLELLFEFQLNQKIPIMSIKLLHKADKLSNELALYFKKLSTDARIHDNKVRVFIIGRWYDLDPELVEAVKGVMEATKDYDDNFLNFCIAYDGQDEIVSGVRVLARQVKAGKIEPDEITDDVVKENLFSSYFPPPDLIIETSRTYSGLLLWDAKNALIHFSDKLFMDTKKEDYLKALDIYKKSAE